MPFVLLPFDPAAVNGFARRLKPGGVDIDIWGLHGRHGFEVFGHRGFLVTDLHRRAEEAP